MTDHLLTSSSAAELITCPTEYGGRWVADGVVRGVYGECLCKAHGEAPCRYRDREGV